MQYLILYNFFMIKYLKEHKTETILVFAITIFALILRIIALQNFGDLWVDELYSKYFASKNSAIDITKALFKEDFHVPFYFVLIDSIVVNKWNLDHNRLSNAAAFVFGISAPT